MPDFCIPKLQSDTQQLGICAIVRDPDPQAIAWVKTRPANECFAEFVEAESGEKRWLECTIEAWERKAIHFHIELSRSELEDTKGEDRTIAEIVDACDEFLGTMRMCKADVRSRIEMEAPTSGLAIDARAFIDVVSRSALSIKSVNLDIDDDVFYSLTLRAMKEQPRVRAVLLGGSDTPLDAEVFDRMAKIMRFGVDRFVLGDISEGVCHA